MKNKKIAFPASLAFWTLIFSANVQAQAWHISNADGFGLPTGTVSGVVAGILSWILGIFGFLGIIAFIISGVFYLTAAGDAEQEKKAKAAMKMAIFGIIVGLVGVVAIKAVDAMLNARSGF
jgi:hypothetical protein